MLEGQVAAPSSVAGAAVRRFVSASTMADSLDRQAERIPHLDSLVFPTSRATFGEFAAMVQRYARSLYSLGVRPHDRVGILLPNDIEQVAMIWAAVKLGAVAAPLNSRFKNQELRQVVVHSGIRILVVGEDVPAAPDFPALVLETFPELASIEPGLLHLAAAPELEHVVVFGGDVGPAGIDRETFEARAQHTPDEMVHLLQSRVKLSDTALLVYTSGTTSSPKGAMINHEALSRTADTIINDRFDLTEDDRLWTSIPLFHAGALTYVLTAVRAGCPYVHPGFFQADRTPAQLEQERVTVAIPGFETIWFPTLNQPDFADRDLSRLRVVVITGVPERLREMAARLPHVSQLSTVGMTEACAFISVGHPDDPYESRMTTGGSMLTGMEFRVIDPETGEPSELGELLIRGTNLFTGYFRDPEITAEVFDDDGWFHTGDICRVDEADRLAFVSRLKDMLKVGGENVAAAEVEGYLLTHPAVDYAQVVAAPDSYYTEVPAAFVELAPGAAATEAELIEFCLGNLATYRVPRYVRFVTEWPMSGTKIKKVVLRQQIADELKAAGITEAPRLRSRKDS